MNCIFHSHNFSLKAGIEALILASPEPLSTSKIISYAIKSKEDINKKQILSILDELERDYSDRGIKLIEAASGWKFKTNRHIATLLLVCGQKKSEIFQGFSRDHCDYSLQTTSD